MLHSFLQSGPRKAARQWPVFQLSPDQPTAKKPRYGTPCLQGDDLFDRFHAAPAVAVSGHAMITALLHRRRDRGIARTQPVAAIPALGPSL